MSHSNEHLRFICCNAMLIQLKYLALEVTVFTE